jgi:hypothetical protein
MSNILPFGPRRDEADTRRLATEIFAFLATSSSGVEARDAVAAFRRQHPELTLADTLQGFSFAKKVLNVFERLVVELDHADDGDAG